MGLELVFLAAALVLLILKYRLMRKYRAVARRRRRAPVTRPGQGPRWFPPAMRAVIMRRDGYRCRICGSRYQLEIDHIIPYSLGGPTTVANGQVLCHACNTWKGRRILPAGTRRPMQLPVRSWHPRRVA